MTHAEDDSQIEAIKQWLRYDPDTGLLWWVKSPGGKASMSKPAGTTRPDGRRQVRVLGRTWKSHRVCWAIYHGRWPVGDLDHENCDPSDNRISNLREATKRENNRNQRKRYGCSSVYKGVSWDKQWRKWRSSIRVNGRLIRLGAFDDEHQAHLAYCAAADQHFGEYARYG